MPIKNYLTGKDSTETVTEIQAILAKAGVQNVSIDYASGEPEAVRFQISVHKQTFTFRLPVNPPGVLATMKRDLVAEKYCNMAHARRVSWRIIKDWLHAQMAIIDAGQVKMAEIFFPYLLESSGETIYQKFENQQLQLTEGKQ